MKIIFLDVDGVLNNTRLREKLKRKGVVDIMSHFDNKSLDLLKELVNISEAKVVITSTIRKFGEDHPKWKNLKNKLQSKGIHIYGKTGISSSFLRDDEIDEYLKALELEGKEVESFVILDDDYADLANHADNLVLTRSGVDMRDGFTYDHFIKAIKILMGENYIYTEGGQI